MSENTERRRPVMLVVDDEEHRRVLHEELLSRAGYAVMTAASGPEALDMVQRESVDLVLLDIAMPGMDGIEAMVKMFDGHRQLPVIIYTAYSTYRDDFMTWTAEAYVTKESSPAELLRAIRETLEKRGLECPEQARQIELEEAEEGG